MKQSLLKCTFVIALCVCMAGALSATLSPARTAHAATPRAASCSGITYNRGYEWYVGEYDSTTSCRGGHLHLTYQDDGNFVLYCYGTALWATNGDAWGGANYTQFQYDGNLVSYTYAATGGPVDYWASNTQNTGYKLVLQGDANLVIYNSSNRAVWASNTSGRC